MTDASVVVVTYQSADVIAACLESCFGRAREVIVVDNASQDGTLAVVRSYPEVRLIANSANRGFAAAVNQGAQAARCPLVLLLNPDAVLLDGLDALAAACLEHGAAAGRLLDEQGRYQRGFGIRRLPSAATLAFEVLGVNRLFPGNPVNRRYRCLDLKEHEPAMAEQPAGAFLMFRRDAWQRVGGFDERFHPVWFEDVDFCKRLLENGFAIRYEPSATARHQGGHAASQLPWATRETHWYGSLLRYAGKHLSRTSLAAVSLAVIAGLLARLVMGIIRLRSIEPVVIYGKLIRSAGRYLVHGDRGGARSHQTNNNQAHIHGL